MNIETGALYEGLDAIRAAEARGEPLARLGERAAAIVRLGNRALAQQVKAKAKRARKVAKQSRKRNRA